MPDHGFPEQVDMPSIPSGDYGNSLDVAITPLQGSWPRSIAPERMFNLAFPYDTIYRNETGHLKGLSATSGLAMLSYLQEHQKLANSAVTDALSLLIDMPAGALDPILWPTESRPSSQGGQQPPAPIPPDPWEIIEKKVGSSLVSGSLWTVSAFGVG